MTAVFQIPRPTVRSVARGISGGEFGLVYPAFVPVADGFRSDIYLDFVNDRSWYNRGSTTAISSILSCTRSGTATYTNAAGIVSDVAANTLRYGDRGLLAEESRTNLCLRSENFSAAWNLGGNSNAPDVDVAPDGATTADRLTMVTSSAVFQTITVTASTTYVFSFWAKRGTRAEAFYRVYDNIGAADITAATSYYSQINSSTYTRVSVAFTTPVGCTSVRVYVDDSTTGGAGTLFVWGAQLEAGAFATSYIRTTTASVTRNADNISFASTAGQLLSRGTWAGEVTEGNGVLTTALCVSMRVDASNNIYPIHKNGSGLMTAVVVVSGSNTVALIGASAMQAGSTYKAAFAYETDNCAQTMTASIDAAQPNTDTNCAMPTGSFTTYVGSINGASAFYNGHIRSLSHWTDRRISNAGLATLVA